MIEKHLTYAINNTIKITRFWLKDLVSIKMPPQTNGSELLTGFIYFTADYDMPYYMCPICRKIFESCLEFKEDLYSHDQSISKIALLVREDWIHAVNDGKHETPNLEVELPVHELNKIIKAEHIRNSAPHLLLSVKREEEISVKIAESMEDDTVKPTVQKPETLDQMSKTLSTSRRSSRVPKKRSAGDFLMTPVIPKARRQSKSDTIQNISEEKSIQIYSDEPTEQFEESLLKKTVKLSVENLPKLSQNRNKMHKNCENVNESVNTLNVTSKANMEAVKDVLSEENTMELVEVKNLKIVEELHRYTEDAIQMSPLSTTNVKKEKITEFCCKECSWKSDRHFNYHRHLFTHTDTHNEETVAPLVCDYCKKKLQSNSGKTGYGQKKVKCRICQEGPMFQSRLIPHMIKEHNITESPISRKPVFYCPDCPYSTVKENLYSEHRRIHDDPEWTPTKKIYNRISRKKESNENSALLHMCDQCPYTTKRSDLMAQHLLRHQPENIVEYQCGDCDFTSLTKKGLTVHEKSHKTNQGNSSQSLSFSCELCIKNDENSEKARQIYNRLNFAEHLESVHQLAEQLFCPQCGKLLEDMESLLLHEPKHNTLFVCFVCGKTARTRELARKHLMSHSEEETHAISLSDNTFNSDQGQHKCEMCDFQTNHIMGLFRHKKIHNKKLVLNFSCRDCPQTFNNITKYNIHLRKEHKVLSFLHQCKMCGYLADNRTGLKQHMMSHSSSRICNIYACDCCNYEATRRWNIIRHKDISHKSEVYACDHCDYNTKSIARITYHFKNVHLVEPPALMKDELLKQTDKGASLSVMISDKRRDYLKRVQKAKRLKRKSKVICDIDNCGKEVSVHMYKRHKERHTGYKRYRCHFQHCTFESLTGSALADHIRKRHLVAIHEPVLSCTQCDFVTADSFVFEKHQETCNVTGQSGSEYMILKQTGDQCQISEVKFIHQHSIQGQPEVIENEIIMDDNSIILGDGETIELSAIDGGDFNVQENGTIIVQQVSRQARSLSQATSTGQSLPRAVSTGQSLPRAASTGHINIVASQHEHAIRSLVTDHKPQEQVTEVYMIIPDDDCGEYITVAEEQ